MRSGIDATTLALYIGQRFDSHIRLRVANGDGTLINLFGRYKSIRYEAPNPNLPIAGLTVDFVRETALASSLAPFVQASTLNRLDDGVTYNPLLQIGRTVRMEIHLTEEGAARPSDSSLYWYEVFRGTISSVKWPQRYGRTATIACTDMGGILQKSKSEAEYTYKAGTPIETAIQQMLTNNGHSWVTLDVPVPTGKVLANDYAPGLQKTAWEQVWSLAQSIGYLTWFAYEGTSDLSLRLFEPPRDKVTTDQTVSIIHDFSDFGIEENEIGNVLYVRYYDADNVQRQAGPFESDASIAVYGGIRRVYWIVFGADSPVRTLSAATEVGEKALSDVADPDVLATVILTPMWFGEAGSDLYSFPIVDGRLFDVPQIAAPFSITTTAQGDQPITSTMALRGKPSAGSKTWFGKRGGGSVPTVETGALGLINFRETVDTAGNTVLSWDSLGALVSEVWEGSVLLSTPIPEDPWSYIVGNLLPVAPGALTVTHEKPPEGQVRYVQVEARKADGSVGIVYRVKQTGTPATVRWDAVPTIAGGQISLAVTVTDPRGIVDEVRFYETVNGVRSGPFTATESVEYLYTYVLAFSPGETVAIQPEIVRNDGLPPILAESFTYTSVALPSLDSASISVVNRPSSGGPGYYDVYDVSWEVGSAVNDTDHGIAVSFYLNGTHIRTLPIIGDPPIDPSDLAALYADPVGGTTITQHSAKVVLFERVSGRSIGTIETAPVDSLIDSTPYP